MTKPILSYLVVYQDYSPVIPVTLPSQAAADKSRSSPGLLAELDPDTATAEELAEAFCR